MDNVLSEMRMRGQSDKSAETILKHIQEGRVDSKLLDFFATQICCGGRPVREINEFSFINRHCNISLLIASMGIGRKGAFPSGQLQVRAHQSKSIST